MKMQRSRKLSLVLAVCACLIGSLNYSAIAADQAEKAKPKPKIKQTRLMIMDRDGSNLKELFRSKQFTFMGSPVYSADGKKIALDGKQTGEGFGATRIFVINADGTEMKDLGSGAMPSWSADGKRMAFSNPSGGGVWMMDADGKNRELVDPMGWGAQWSPDGKLISYSEGANIKIFDTEEETFRYVFPFDKCPFSRFYWNSSWSPDSKSICLKARSKQNNYEIATIEIDKGVKGVKVYYSDPKTKPSEDIAWHPDGKQIVCACVFKEHKKRKLISYDLSKNSSEWKIIPGQNAEERSENMCWSPDGKQLIFTAIKH